MNLQLPQNAPSAGHHPSIRLAYVDGLRGIAVGAVLIFHSGIWGTLWGTPWEDNLRKITSLGHTGVDLFLVLSGFCLFWPVINRSKDEIAPLKLREYFRRRIRRIFPPYYAAFFFSVAACYLNLQ